MEGFIPHTIGNTEQTAFRWLPVTDNYTYEVGQALYFSSGKLTAASGTNKPEYICMEHKEVESGATETICATPIREDIIYETHASASVSGVAIGAKVTLNAANTTDPWKSGQRVTGTTSSGVAEIVGTAADPLNNAADKAVGCKVYVRFSV